jgi:hypothetical protein
MRHEDHFSSPCTHPFCFIAAMEAALHVKLPTCFPHYPSGWPELYLAGVRGTCPLEIGGSVLYCCNPNHTSQ